MHLRPHVQSGYMTIGAYTELPIKDHADIRSLARSSIDGGRRPGSQGSFWL